MPDHRSFQGDAAEIRSLLAGTDPAAGALAAQVTTLMSRIRDGIVSTGVPPARSMPRAALSRRWWPNRPARKRQRRTVVVYAAIPALLAATGAAWVVTSSAAPSGMIDCYSAASLHPHSLYLGRVSTGQTPIGYCAHAWAIGAVTGNPHSHTVPPLVACEVKDAIGVFPDTTCARLGLRPLSARYLGSERRIVSFENYLQQRLRPAACVHQRQAEAIADQALARYGFTSWHLKIESRFWITGARLDPATSCVISMVYSDTHVVELAMNPGPHTSFGRFSAAFAKLGGSCRPGSKPFGTSGLFTPRMRLLFARALPGWTIGVIGPRADRAHPCYGISYDAHRRQMRLFGPTVALPH